jgi:uncharacterized protein YaaR (DUF327 family)
MWNVLSVPKNKSKNSKTSSLLKKIDANSTLAQIEILGERLIHHGELEDSRQYQRLVRDLSHWAARADSDEDEEESNIQYVDPYAPVLQRAIDRGLIRLHTKIKEIENHSTLIAGLIDEIQSNLRDLIALKQK